LPQRLTAIVLMFFAQFAMHAFGQKVRISAWYWLNSAPKVAWQGDFVTMKNMGFTDVVLCWGVDLAAVSFRTADTRKAIEEAHSAGLGSYLVIWQPTANSLPRRPEFQQVDSAGNRLFSFDVFNNQWRQTEWKHYLQQVAKAYRDEPGMAGYVFDDSFTLGPVGKEDGPAGTGVVSYGKYEEERFGRTLPRKATDPRWSEWVSARQGWWEEWAKDTVAFLREVDSNRRHEIYLEDPAENALNPKLRDTVGLDFARVAKYFDAVGAYSSFPYTSSPDDGARVAQGTRDILTRLKQTIGAEKDTTYTFWVADPAEEFIPGLAKYPTAQQIRQIAEAALQAGVRHLDMYGYRIGEFRVASGDLERLTPGTHETYPLTGQFPQKFLWDRPEIQDELAAYLRSLNAEPKAGR
jgi:hypothetical protein